MDIYLKQLIKIFNKLLNNPLNICIINICDNDVLKYINFITEKLVIDKNFKVNQTLYTTIKESQLNSSFTPFLSIRKHFIQYLK